MAVLRPEQQQEFLEGPAHGRSSYCVFSPPCEATEIHVQNRTTEMTEEKDLQKKKAKADTQSSEQKRDETRYFTAKGQIGEDCTWGSN